jgi:hypothetical protein
MIIVPKVEDLFCCCHSDSREHWFEILISSELVHTWLQIKVGHIT